MSGQNLSTALTAAGTAAGMLLETASTLSDSATAAFDGVEYPFYEGYGGGAINFGFSGIYLPAIGLSAFQKPGAPADPVIGDVTYISPTALAAFTVPAPIVNPIAVPSTQLPGAPGAAPALDPVAFPGGVTIDEPVLPQLANITLDDAPALTLSPYTFAFSAPVNVADYTDKFSYTEAQYTSLLKDTLVQKLLNDLNNGGYGIEVNDEAGVWARARERETRNTELAIQDASRQIAARGFMVPPGVLNNMVAAATQQAIEKNSSLSRDIMVKKADLYQEHRKFTLDESQKVEQMLETFFGYAQERAIQAAKAIVELGVRAYEAQLAKLNYKISEAREAAMQYETQLKVQLLPLQVWKDALEGKKVAAMINQQQVDIFKAEWDAQKVKVDAHRLLVETAKAQSEFNMLKLQAFKLAVDVYAEQVKAKEAEFGMYESSVRGEVAKVEAFKAQVDAYAGQASAKKLEYEGRAMELNAKVQSAQLVLDRYKGAITKYVADIQGSVAAIDAEAKVAEVAQRSAGIAAEAQGQIAQASIMANKAASDIAMQNAKISADVAIARAAQTQSVAAAIASTSNALAGIYGQAAMAVYQAAAGISADIQVV